MAWKIEKWMRDVFPGLDSIYEEYAALGRRELAIVAAGVLDAALAELISLRVLDLPTECEEFLGANEDGRAPAASFGARIQLALLLGIIHPCDAAVLRSIKAIRNKFAHRVNVDFTSPQVRPLSVQLYDRMQEVGSIIRRGRSGSPEPTSEERVAAANVRAAIESTEEAGAGLLLSAFCLYQAYLHRMHCMTTRIERPKLDWSKVP